MAAFHFFPLSNGMRKGPSTGRLLLPVLLVALLAWRPGFAGAGFDAFEKTIPELQAAMAAGEVTAEELVRQYLDRIDAFDRAGPALRAVILVNPEALETARLRDRERAAGQERGPLHGIPVVLKDNYDTADMPTTAGALALAGHVPPDDAYQVARLREAGAVVVAKTNMHELARGIETISSLGGQTLNPYDPARNPGGSSGGTGAAVAANYAAVGMGSDTCGSIRIPAANNNLFGLRVTQGLSSRDGIIPLSHTQDVGGPLGRSMIDLALVLDITVGPDPSDPQTAAADGKVPPSFAALASSASLEGLRIGLLRSYLADDPPYGDMSRVVLDAVDRLREAGAETVDVDIAGLEDLVSRSGVIGFEVESDLADYFERSAAPVASMQEVLDSGLYHVALERRFRDPYPDGKGPADYPGRLAARSELAGAILRAMQDAEADVLAYPTLRVKPKRIGEGQFGSACQLAAHSGFPALTMPAGFTADGVPAGIELLAAPFEDGLLVSIGFAWEKLASPRRAPARTPSLLNGKLVHEFAVDGDGMRGALRLDVPTQTLHYAIDVTGAERAAITGIRVHRGASGENGPVTGELELSGRGAWAVRNQDLPGLLEDGLYVAVYTLDKPRGALRAQILRR